MKDYSFGNFICELRQRNGQSLLLLINTMKDVSSAKQMVEPLLPRWISILPGKLLNVFLKLQRALYL